MNTRTAISLIATLLIGSTAATLATPVPYFTASGKQTLGGSQTTWNVDATAESVAFELHFDFTADMNDGQTYALWGAGGNGAGSNLVLENGNLHYFAGNDVNDVVSGPIGVTAPFTQLQVVSLITFNQGPSMEERLQIFANGIEVANGLTESGGLWAGGDGEGLGVIGSGTHRYDGTALFTSTAVVDYPNTAIEFAVYRQADPSYDLNQILIPEPMTSHYLLLGLGLLGAFRRPASRR